jgi:hypothetical protein
MAQIIRTVSANGDKVNWTLEVCNNSALVCFNAQVAIDIPTGVRLSGPSELNSSVIIVPVGYYNLSDNTWYLGDLSANECSTVNLEFTVDDVNQADPIDNRFTIPATLTTSCAGDDASNNIQNLIIEVTDPCSDVDLSVTIAESSGGKTDLSIG